MRQFMYVILTVALLFGTIVIQEYKVMALERKVATVDSLMMEIELRDELLIRCKDTVYGEEVIETYK